ncbi:uncharacterized protein [Osmerus mordax]|uniref:uncharacterized protein n=1 Tax=Osmerus mordax TaxID=8014 RepID=UPI00350ECDF2
MMCKVESSTDSESDVSPRWSDTSTMGCGSSAAESRQVQRSLLCGHKPAGRHPSYHCLSIDPYDGSSEDSDVSDSLSFPWRQRQPQAGCRCWGRTGRRVPFHSAPPLLRGISLNELRVVETEPGRAEQNQQKTLDVQMRSTSELDHWSCGLETSSCGHSRGGESNLTEGTFESGGRTRSVDSGMHSTCSPFPCVGENSLCHPEMSSEKSVDSPFTLSCASKRKFGLLGLPGKEEETRKRLCVSRMDMGEDSTMDVYSVR